MQLQNHFDLAHLVGHTAFDHLADAMSVYDKVRCAGWLDLTPHLWTDCLLIGGQLDMLRRAELKECVQAVILFQAMMEKLPYFVPSIGSNLNSPSYGEFAGSWNDLLSQIKDPTTQGAAKAAFDSYNINFYKAFRNPIIHGKNPKDISEVNKIRIPGVYEGMRQGWRAYDYLLTEAFAPQQKHEPSWAVMCKSHGISDTLNLPDYPDLFDLEAEFNKKHLDGARAAAKSDE